MSFIIKFNEADPANARPQAQRVAASRGYPARLKTDALKMRWKEWVLFLGLTTMFVIAALWRPADEPQFILCPFRALTHYPCPGCGMTRAFCALAHGEFLRAVKFNALSPLLFLVALTAWAYSAGTVLRIERMRSFFARPNLQPSPFAAKLMLALALSWWVIRVAGNF
jgi:hypothetical protein